MYNIIWYCSIESFTLLWSIKGHNQQVLISQIWFLCVCLHSKSAASAHIQKDFWDSPIMHLTHGRRTLLMNNYEIQKHWFCPWCMFINQPLFCFIFIVSVFSICGWKFNPAHLDLTDLITIHMLTWKTGSRH